jgi:hypothetical protein
MRIKQIFLLILCLFISSRADALVHSLAPSIASEVLSETVPTAFSPMAIQADDFSVEWEGTPLTGVRFLLGKKSLEWVRTADFLALPRGRLILVAEGIEGAQVQNAGFTQSFEVRAGTGRAEMPIALLSGEKNPVLVKILRGGKIETGVLLVRFTPRKPFDGPRVFTDPSCSPHRVKFESTGARDDEWVYIGCRLVYSEGDEERTSSLEMFVYWDNVGQSIKIDGIETLPASPSVWALRLRSSPKAVRLKAGDHELTLQHNAPEKLKLGSFSVGLGPYAYRYDAPGVAANAVVPLVTVYGSYFIFETVRIVAFNATAVHSAYNTDFGIYLSQESLKTLDRRISVNVMLGAHFLGYKASNQNMFQFGAPQGFEIVFRDFAQKSRNLTFGSFIYPLIDGKEYYNTWVRWGTGSVFAELNYIGWREPLENGERAFSRSVGISVGMPWTFRFF